MTEIRLWCCTGIELSRGLSLSLLAAVLLICLIEQPIDQKLVKGLSLPALVYKFRDDRHGTVPAELFQQGQGLDMPPALLGTGQGIPTAARKRDRRFGNGANSVLFVFTISSNAFNDQSIQIINCCRF